MRKGENPPLGSRGRCAGPSLFSQWESHELTTDMLTRGAAIALIGGTADQLLRAKTGVPTAAGTGSGL
jgi:hypothetical protein